MSQDELDAFCRKVAALKAEGLSCSVIAERLGVYRTTLYQRMRRYEDEQERDRHERQRYSGP